MNSPDALHAAIDAFAHALREASRDPSIDLATVERQLRVWLDDVRDVIDTRRRKAEGRCECGRRLEPDGLCRASRCR